MARFTSVSRPAAERAKATVEKTLARMGAEIDPEHVQVLTDPQALAEATFVVEAVIEDLGVKSAVLGELNGIVGAEAVLASTTSSLSVQELAKASGRAERFVGLHVFNPVTKMRLVELVFAAQASEDTRRRALELCETLKKTPVEVPDVPGFVVNRLLFPYLFSAVRLYKRDPSRLPVDHKDRGRLPASVLEPCWFADGGVCKASTTESRNRWLVECTSPKGVDVAGELVRLGFACAALRSSPKYLAAENEARSARRGLWSASAGYNFAAYCKKWDKWRPAASKAKH